MNIKEWMKNITSEDIDLIDKLENMCNNEINEELYNLINSNTNKYYPRIEKYIKEHVSYYVDFIVTETQSLYNQDLIDSNEYWSSGLYNCDEIYVKAIVYALGILWLP